MSPSKTSSLAPSVENSSLKKRVLNAGTWTLISYAFSYAFRLGSNLLMTRLLLPEMFGVMAIAMMVLVGLALFSDVGLKPSVVQNKRGDDPLFLNTAWTIQIARGAVLWFGGFAVSLLIAVAGRFGMIPHASVYADPILPYVIGVLSLFSLISGFESTKSLQASRNLQLAKLTRIDVGSQVVGFVVTVSYATAFQSIWALVAGTLAGAATRTVLTHLSLPGVRNHFAWDRAAYAEIMRFGKWIFLSSVLFFIASNGDRMLLGALIDPASLGTYSIAFLIFSSIDQVLTKIIVDVSFPALSEVVRNDRAGLRAAYYRFHVAIASGAYFCAGALIFSGNTLISLLYDRRYGQAGWMLEILALALFAQPFRTATQTFLALGMARIYFQLHTIRIVTLFVALPAGFYFWGLEGAVYGVVLSYFSSVPWVIKYAATADLFDWKKELIPIPAAVLGVLCGGAFALSVARLAH